jgi:signal transduction histidine kinase
MLDRDSAQSVNQHSGHRFQHGGVQAQTIFRGLQPGQIKSIDIKKAEGYIEIRTESNERDSSERLSTERKSFRTILSDSSSALPSIHITRFASPDSISRSFRFPLFPDTLDVSLLERRIKLVLQEHKKDDIHFEIINRTGQQGGGSPPWMEHDDDPYTTSFLRFGRGQHYALHFPEGESLVRLSLLPQIAFSILLSMMVGVSFWLIYKNLLVQQKLVEQKNMFISNVTHELKTPVATVSVAIEALKSFNALDNPRRTREYLDIAGMELERLSLMTDKILKTSLFDYKEEIVLHKSPVALDQLAEKVLTAFKPMAEKRKANLSYTHTGNCTVSGSEEHLINVIYNLVENAFKYSPEAPQISIQLYEEAQQVIMEVADRGAGIPEAYQDKIFDKFFRVPTGDVHTVKGYGLGLSYVAGVVKAHGGKISLKSQPGAGTRFRVVLPR